MTRNRAGAWRSVETTETYGTFSLDEDGSWIYRLDNADPDTDALAAGQAAADSFSVTSADGTAARVTIAVTGANDAAVIGGELTGAATEDAAETAARGRLTVNDPDGEDGFAAATDLAGTYGTFSLDEDGSWTYRLDNADPDTDALTAGQTATDSFAVASADGTAATVAVTVTGANDAAAIGGELTGAATEDAASSAAQGRLTVTDPDAGQDTFAATDLAGTYGTFSLGEDGSWIYRLDNADPDTDALTAGQTATDSFAVTSADGTAATVAIAVTGANDAAVIGGDLTGAATEDAAETAATGRLTVSDPDGEDGFAAETGVAGTYGTFSLDADGSWIYRLDNADPDTDALAAGQAAADSFAVTSADGTATRVTIAVTGANDAAVIGGDLTGAVTEDAAETAARGRLTVSDPDADQGPRIEVAGNGPDAGQDMFAATDLAGTYGTFSLGEDGSWIYRLDNADPDTDALTAGQTAADSFAVTSADGTAALVTIAVTGANDAAVIGGDLTGAVTEDVAETAARGRLTVSDPDADQGPRIEVAGNGPDAGQDMFAATDLAGTYGTFSLGEDGSWIYRLDNADPDTDALAAGQAAADSFAVTSADGTAALVTIAVTGANDAAVIGGDLTGAATEDAAETAAQGRLTVRDPDAGQDTFAAQSEVAGTYGTFSLGEDGSWTYRLDNADPDTDALTAGQTATDSFSVTSADGTAATVAVTVTGANDVDATPRPDPEVEAEIILAPHTPIHVDIGEPDSSPVPAPDRNGEEFEAPHEEIFDDSYLIAVHVDESSGLELIAHWSMDELIGKVFPGGADGRNNAIFFSGDGTPELVELDAATERGLKTTGAAARLDGNDKSYIAIAHNKEFEVEKGTIMFWFNADDIGGRQVLFAKDAAGPGNHLKIGLNGASLEVRMQDGADNHVIATDNIIEAGAWHHLAFSFGPDGMKLFLNGVQVGENAATAGLSDNLEPIVIGGSNHLNNDQSGALSKLRIDDSFSGLVDEVMVYGQNFDARQIAHLNEMDPTTSANSESAGFVSARTGEEWAWDVEISKDGGEGAYDILVPASEYVPVPDVPDWLMEVHETGFDDGYGLKLLAGALIGPAVRGLRSSARCRQDNGTGEVID